MKKNTGILLIQIWLTAFPFNFHKNTPQPAPHETVARTEFMILIFVLFLKVGNLPPFSLAPLVPRRSHRSPR